MKIQIKRIDKTLPLPEYQTAGSVGFDFYARETTEVKSKEIILVPTNLIITAPPGYMLAIFSRSSTPRKKGLILANSVGIVDRDYCGPNDEIQIMVYNFTDNAVKIERGERIAQGIFVRVDNGEWNEVEEISSSNRGGFGSTDK